VQPSKQPSRNPTNAPQLKPTAQPIAKPSSGPSSQPNSRPSGQPSFQPIVLPSAQPIAKPSSGPSSQPNSRPSGQPSKQPSSKPSRQPNAKPSFRPSAQPNTDPLSFPTNRPSSKPTDVNGGTFLGNESVSGSLLKNSEIAGLVIGILAFLAMVGLSIRYWQQFLNIINSTGENNAFNNNEGNVIAEEVIKGNNASNKNEGNGGDDSGNLSSIEIELNDFKNDEIGHSDSNFLSQNEESLLRKFEENLQGGPFMPLRSRDGVIIDVLDFSVLQEDASNFGSDDVSLNSDSSSEDA
jgi:hypothetical protein